MWFSNLEEKFSKVSSEEKIDTIIATMSDAEKKAVIIALVMDIVEGTTSSIDKEMGELLLTEVIKSTGNNITAFIVKDR